MGARHMDNKDPRGTQGSKCPCAPTKCRPDAGAERSVLERSPWRRPWRRLDGRTVVVALIGCLLVGAATGGLASERAQPAAAAAVRAGGDAIMASSARFTPRDGGTEFTLRLDGAPRFRAFPVDQPPRLVIDLEATRFDVDDPVPAQGLVSAWRFGALSEDAARIVFDLDEPALLESQGLTAAGGARGSGHTLNLRLVPVAAEAFADAVARADPRASAVEPPSERPTHTVVIDPGHGGVDPGAVGPGGVLEKELVLAFSQRLQERLAAFPHIEVQLTRSDDRFLSLSRRVRIARAYEADLFLSIHADSAPQDYVTGATVYTLSERPSDAAAAALAARENLSDRFAGIVEPESEDDVGSILADLLRRETKTFSAALAQVLVNRMGEVLRMNSNPLRSARFRVLMAPDIPSVLIELGYLTNAADTVELLKPAWQDRAAGAVAAGVADYFAQGLGVAGRAQPGEEVQRP